MPDPRERFAVAVVAIVVHGRDPARVLALKRAPHKTSPGVWESVSGHLLAGETLEAAALRETHEETGLTPRGVAGPIDAYVLERATEPLCLVCYRVEVDDTAVVLSSEHDQLGWWTLAECHAHMPPRLAAAVARALAY